MLKCFLNHHRSERQVFSVYPSSNSRSPGKIGECRKGGKLPISRLQRDLTDSTVLRNMGVALGYTLLGYDSLQRGLSKLQVNEAALAADLDAAWEVLAEAVQTVMRRHGLPNPYEQLKKMTRGKAITAAAMRKFVATLALPAAEKKRLLALTPAGYTGKAAELARRV